jgi:hypothetical protein
LDLTGVTNQIDIEAAQTTTFELANNASLLLSANQAAALFDGVAENQTLTIDTDGANLTAAVQNVATLNLVNDSTTASTVAVTVDADDDGTDAGSTVVVSGSGDITFTGGAQAFDTLNASASTGNISATAAAALDTITTGAGDDTVIAYAGDHTVVMGAGDDTYSIGVDISADTVSVTGHDIVTLTANTTMTFAQANTLLAGTTVGGAFTLSVNGTSSADTLNISTAVESATALTEITVDAGAGNDTININDEFTHDLNYSSGVDGTDTINGFVSLTDDFDTDFVTTAGGAGFATSASVTADTASALTLTAAGSGSSSATDGYLITVDSLAGTTDADVIAAISNGTVNINAASDKFMMMLNDGTSSWLFEVTAAAGNTTLTAADDAIVHVATFTDEVLAAGDII